VVEPIGIHGVDEHQSHVGRHQLTLRISTASKFIQQRRLLEITTPVSLEV
jgi:hypothetical protein